MESLFKSDRRGSNPRSRPWQGRALPTTPLSQILLFHVLRTSDILLHKSGKVKCFFEKIKKIFDFYVIEKNFQDFSG